MAEDIKVDTTRGPITLEVLESVARNMSTGPFQQEAILVLCAALREAHERIERLERDVEARDGMLSDLDKKVERLEACPDCGKPQKPAPCEACILGVPPDPTR